MDKVDRILSVVNRNYKGLVTDLKKPSGDIRADLTDVKMDMLHMAIGISTEVAELMTGVINLALSEEMGEPKHVAEAHKENIKEELGDILFYVTGLNLAIGRIESLYCDDVAFEPHDLPECDLSTVGIAGELLDILKKHCIYNKPLDLDALITMNRHMDNSLFFVAEKYGWVRRQIIRANIDKLCVRYDGGYTDHAAQKRADKPEGE